MKKILSLLSLFVLLCAFTCENESLEGDFQIEEEVTCETALQNTVDAALAFVNFTEDNYTELCTVYKEALQAQIDACGDPDGALQSGIDALGNCIPGTGDDCENATSAVNLAQVNFENASADFYTDFCNSYKLALQNQIVECGDDDGSIQTIIDDLGDCINQPNECELATTAANVAEIAFNNATDDDYTDLCNTYKDALQAKIDVCGDDDGSIQTMIDDLGNCTQATPEVEISVIAGGLIEFDLVDVVVDGTTLKVTAETSAANNYMIYFEVEQGATGTDIINSTFSITLTSEFFPSTQGFEDYTSEITENTATTIVGTFWGTVTNTDGGDLSLTQGVINIIY